MRQGFRPAEASGFQCSNDFFRPAAVERAAELWVAKTEISLAAAPSHRDCPASGRRRAPARAKTSETLDDSPIDLDRARRRLGPAHAGRRPRDRNRPEPG